MRSSPASICIVLVSRSINMLSVADFVPKGIISGVRVQAGLTMIQCSTLCTQRKVTKFPCFWCFVFGAQFQHFLEFFLPSFFAMQLALVSMITVTFISSLSVFSLQRTRHFRTRGD